MAGFPSHSSYHLIPSGVNYRKSVNPESAFPGNLLDAFSAYQYVNEVLKFGPQHIALMGDSAGGGTALALTRYLGDLADAHKKGKIDKRFAEPRGMMLFSVSCGRVCEVVVVETDWVVHLPALGRLDRQAWIVYVNQCQQRKSTKGLLCVYAT